MKLARSARTLFSAALFLAAPAAMAQNRAGTTEVTLFGGGYFGGRLYSGSNQIFDRSVDVSDEPTYGIRVGYNINRWFGLEAGFSRAESHVTPRFRSDFDGVRNLGDFESRHFEGNFVFNFGKRRFQPYVTLGAGATQFRTNFNDGFGTETNTRFTANFGGGMKFWVTPRFGIRLDARGRSAYIAPHYCDESDSAFCRTTDDFYRDYENDHRRWYTSGETTAGFTFAF
jgi:opacity protein-like surface antigen